MPPPDAASRTALLASRPAALLAATTTAAYGVLFYAYGVLLLPMAADLGWDRTFLSGVFSVALLVAALATVPVGRWLDRHPPRALFVPAGATASLLVVAWAATSSRFVFVVVWVLLGGCQAVLFYEPAFTVLTKWYEGRARHRAITNVTLVAGLASTVFGPLTALLERRLGWRGALLVLAGILFAVAVPALALLRRPPAAAGVAVPDPEDPLPREALRDGRLWLVTVAYLFAAFTSFAVAVHLVGLLESRGLSTSVAATVLGMVGLAQVLGRSTFVRLSDGRPVVELGTAVLAAKAIGLAMLLVVPGWPGVVAFVAVYGAANGMATLTRALTVAELFGAQHYGAISAVVAAVGAIGGATAPFVAAAAIDLLGSESRGFVVLLACALAAVAANAIVTPYGIRRAVGSAAALDEVAPAPEA